jgi:hypothetical protein
MTFAAYAQLATRGSKKFVIFHVPDGTFFRTSSHDR